MQKDLNLIKKQIKEMQLNHKPTSDKDTNFKILAEIAKLRLGKIKEGEVYVNTITKMIFIDQLGNEFKMIPSEVKRGVWSPYEYNNPEYHIKELEKIVAEKGGKIKEGEVYINNKTKMIFIDQLGNEFKMRPSSIKIGGWSPYESGSVYNNPNYHMQELERIATKKGGRIKEDEVYINSNTKMSFIDKLGNQFEMAPSAVKQGQWSPHESDNVRDSEYHMKKLEEIVTLKGGKIKKGEIYINNKTKMIFIDKGGNEFKATPNHIKRGRWSPYEKNFSENICRQIIEQLYNKKFPSSWDIIKRENGNRLQLDGYCKELNIAFEYQGIQHKIGWKNKDKNKQEEDLIDITKRDNEKKQACKDLKILLIEVNYYKKFNNINDIITQTLTDVKNSYESNNIELPYFISNLNLSEIKIDLSKINHLVLMQKQLEEIVTERGGRIKEGEKYINNKTKMIFIDKLGNEFKMNSHHIKRGVWSPYEYNNPEYHMKKIEEILAFKGRKIKEGEVYINNQTKMIFIDKLGNEFKNTPANIKANHRRKIK